MEFSNASEAQPVHEDAFFLLAVFNLVYANPTLIGHLKPLQVLLAAAEVVWTWAATQVEA